MKLFQTLRELEARATSRFVLGAPITQDDFEFSIEMRNRFTDLIAVIDLYQKALEEIDGGTEDRKIHVIACDALTDAQELGDE
jgi:hypothetical protein